KEKPPRVTEKEFELVENHFEEKASLKPQRSTAEASNKENPDGEVKRNPPGSSSKKIHSSPGPGKYLTRRCNNSRRPWYRVGR
ncbi:MAG: hypothetical protein ABSC61_02070, partial [Anaerolineales bacterium]